MHREGAFPLWLPTTWPCCVAPSPPTPGPPQPCATTLAPLREYDRLHNGDLLHSLEVYFREGENLSRAAGLLFLHRNSLYYRLAHVQALTGLSLDDEAARIWLHLAVLLDRAPADEEDRP